MQGQPPAAGDAAKTSPLQDKKVQIGLGVGAVVILGGIVAGVLMMKPSGSSATSTPTAPTAAVPGGPAGAGPSAMPTMGPPGGSPMGGPGMAGPSGMGGSPGMPGAPGATGGATAAAETKPAGPAVPSRKNAFQPNKELKTVMGSIPEDPKAPTVYATAHDLFLELNPPKPEVEVADQGADQGPPIPPMRVTGIVLGNVVSAVLQLGDGNAAQFINVVPGKTFPEGNPVYRVASIENGTVTLVRRWEEGNRKGVQRIEVTLAGSSGGTNGFGGGAAGADFN